MASSVSVFVLSLMARLLNIGIPPLRKRSAFRTNGSDCSTKRLTRTGKFTIAQVGKARRSAAKINPILF